MILNVIKEGEYTNNNTNTLEVKEIDSNIDKVQLKRIKELLVEKDLRYVSPNVKNLLGITKEDDPTCFSKSSNSSNRRVIQVGEKFRVILYIRLSQEDGDLQNGDVSGSIKNQLLYLLDECNKRDWVVVGIFCEEDISGVDDNRPEWLKSIRFAEVGNTEIVLCKSQSRFTRSLEMVEKYLHKLFPEWNIRFLGLVDNSDTDIVENKKSRQINGLVNEWFVEDTSKSTRATLDSMKRNGQFTGSFAPYGYDRDPNDKHHLIPDLYARQAVRIMAGMLKHGKGMPQIIEVLMRKRFLTPADYKTSKGIPINRGKNVIKSVQYKVEEGETLKSIAYKFYFTVQELKELNNLSTDDVNAGDIIIIPHKQRWTSNMIRNIVTDETQIGTLVQGKSYGTSFKNKKPIFRDKKDWIRVPHCHEANLDLETFEIVNSMFNKVNKNRPQKNGEISLFSKKVFCSCCGASFNKNNSKCKNKNREYLRCRGSSAQKNHACPNKEMVDLKEFKKYILENIKKKIDEYYDLTKVSKEYYLQNIYSNVEKNIENLEKDKINIEMDIDNKEKVLVQLYSDKVSGTLSEDEFKIIKSSNTIEINRLKEKLLDIDSEINTLKSSQLKEIEKEKIFEKYKDITELNKVVLDTFISRIEIGEVDSETSKRPIDIEWNLCVS